MSGESGGSAFDIGAEAYDAQLARGLALAGEDREFFARGRVRFLRRWWSLRMTEPPARIIDWGCGTGQGTALLADAFRHAEVVGLDSSGRSIDEARSQFGSSRVRFERVHGDGVVVGVQPADLVHLNGVVHHVPPHERRRFFAGLREHAAPSGVVSLFENNPLNPGTHLVMARIPFDRDAIKVPHWEAARRLREAGLRPEATRFLFFFPRRLGALRGLERGLERVPLGAQYCVIARRDV